MPLTIPDLETFFTRLVADYQARFPNASLSRFKGNWKRMRSLAMAGWGLLHAAKITYDDLFPDTASDEALDHLGFIWGVTRKGATPARKADALRVTGTAASALTLGDELVHTASGLLFQVNENTVISGAGFVDVDIVAIDTGKQTRLQAGEELKFSAPPAGVNTTAELQLDLDEDGTDRESPGEYRVRILAKIAQPGMGGNANDYRTWGIEETGIAAVYVYPLRRGRGSVDVAALHAGSGSVRPLTAGEITDLQAAYDLKRPVSKKSFRVLTVTATEKDVELTITPRSGAEWAFDWDDSGGPLLVDTWTAGTRLLKFTTDRPGDMEVGDRIVIQKVAGTGKGEPIEIEAFGGADDEVILKAEPEGAAPVNLDLVYAGGNLTEAVRDQIIAHIDELGPAVGDYGTGEWDSDLDPQRLEAIALDVEGVRRADCITPGLTAVASDPAFPNDGTIELFIPGQIVVRKG